MIPTLKELPLGTDIPNPSTKARAVSAKKDGARVPAEVIREAFSALVDGLSAEGERIAVETDGLGAPRAGSVDGVQQTTNRAPDWASQRLNTASFAVDPQVAPAAKDAPPDVKAEADVSSTTAPDLPEKVAPVPAAMIPPERKGVSGAALVDAGPEAQSATAAPARNETGSKAPVAAQSVVEELSRIDAQTSNASGDSYESRRSLSAMGATDNLSDAPSARSVVKGSAEDSRIEQDNTTVAPLVGAAEAPLSLAAQAPSNEQPERTEGTSGVGRPTSSDSAPPSNDLTAEQAALAVASSETRAPSQTSSPAPRGALASTTTVGDAAAPEIAVPSRAEAPGDTSARVGVEAPPVAPARDAALQTVARSDGAANAATDAAARPERATEREPRAGTAILATTAERAANAQPVAAPVAPTVSTNTTAQAPAPAVTPPTFAAAEAAARLVEGDAEKAAQGALAADAEVSLTPVRAERDAEFRAMLRQAPAAPVPAANLAREVMQAAISAKGSGSIELHIDPVELGKLDIEFSVVDDRMNIIVRAERDEALELMRRNADELEKMLRDAGVDLGSLSFSQDRSNDPKQVNRFGIAGRADDDAASAAPASILPPAGATDRLDIRV